MKYLITLLGLCLIYWTPARAQSCDCEKEFLYLKNYHEQNHPGLNSPGGKDSPAYKKATQDLLRTLRKARPQADCILYLQDYLALLKDHHISITPSLPKIIRFDVTNPVLVDSLYRTAAFRSTPQRQVDSTTLARQLNTKTTGELEGWYTDPNHNLIAIVKESGSDWPYQGIVVTSKTPLFPRGTVKYQFQKRPNGTYWTTLVLPDHQKFYYATTLMPQGIPSIGLTRVNAQSEAEPRETRPYAFSSLNERTNYLRVSSFDGSLSSDLNSFYQSVDSLIRSKPYLVIDIRNNRGGSDGSFWGLIDYLYTNPIQTDTAAIWVSPDNITRYEEAVAHKKQNPNQYSPDNIEREETLIRRMKAARPFSFMPMVEGDPAAITSDTVLPYPAKIVVLMNRQCASSAEAFIYYAKQSRKVLTMGENSGGFMGFGNVMESQTPCYQYTVRSTTFKYKNLSQYEYIGIDPHIRLSPNQDWLAEVVKELEGR
ncbi:S41 family peptidase [Telluribacter humicola]|uniref:S41 family peptidase n=1 Tax=Telluribacter humicola TaxID=1720261 RepID=UPI001A9576FD|nr:S41 family peptidase [Telluribacter humicola]